MPNRKNDVPKSHETLLLDIYQRLGVVETQNTQILDNESRAADSRAKIYQAHEAIRADVADVKGKLTTVVAQVASMEPDVTKMKGFRAQLAIAVFIVTSVVTGAINLVWIAVTHLGDIKSALRSFLNH